MTRRIGWIDGGAGASGDMLLGALVGAGVALDVVRASLDPLGLGVDLRSEEVTRGGLGATRVHVEVPSTEIVRHLADVVELLGPLEVAVRDRAVAVFRRLAAAEAAVHRTSIDEVHFHEVGALDSIADVVGVCAGLVHLGLDELWCSTLSLGRGSTRGAHGPIPVPAPAVLALLEGTAPVAAGPAPVESTTPTGAALLAEWVGRWGPLPPMVTSATGVGAGARDLDEVANACRLVVGDAVGATAGPGAAPPDAPGDPDLATDVVTCLEANVDDLDPRLWPAVVAGLLEGGALDAWTTPIVMKKGRPATTLSVLCDPADAPALRRAVLTETSTIGVRERALRRHVLDRRTATVRVGGRPIRVKLASIGDEVVNRGVEWDDVAAAAAALGRPAKAVLADAIAAAAALGAELVEPAAGPTGRTIG